MAETILTLVDRSQLLAAACRRHGLAAVYLFGSAPTTVGGSWAATRSRPPGRISTAPDPLAADLYELVVMRRGAELLPIERELERDMFGVSTA